MMRTVSYCIMAIVLGLCAQNLSAQTPRRVIDYLPPGYSIPRIAPRKPSAGELLRNGGLVTRERHMLYHAPQFDRSVMNWADATLRISVGFEIRWTPKNYYEFLPLGYDAEPNRAIAFLSLMKIRFAEPFDPSQDRVLRSLNLPEYTLYRHESYVVLERGDDRRWYFESPDGGGRWRLSKIELIQHPGMFTELEYEEGLVTAIKYPSGDRATIEYQAELPVTIDTPFGEFVQIERGPGGFIKKIDVYRKTNSGLTRRPIRQYHYERDGTGRITRFINEWGQEYRVEYTLDQLAEDKTQKNIYTTTVHNVGGGTYYTRRHEIRDNHEWFVTELYGHSNRPPQDAYIERQWRSRLVNHRWSMVSYSRGDDHINTHYEVDQLGNPKIEVTPAGQTIARKYNRLSKPIEETDPENGTTIREYNTFGQVTKIIDPQGRETLYDYDANARLIRKLTPDGLLTTYEYDEHGFPSKTTIDGDVCTFTYDVWGRMTGYQMPNGEAVSSTYNAYGDMVAHEFINNDYPDQGYPSVSYRYERNPAGQITGIHFQTDKGDIDGKAEIYHYDKVGRMIVFIRATGERMRYEYDDAGRLFRAHAPGWRSAQYLYHPSGRKKTVRSWNGFDPWMEREYDQLGRLIEKRITGETPTRYLYNDAGELITTLPPSGLEAQE